MVSDTLRKHYDNGHVTRSTTCKVIVQRGRIMFNAGAFSDLEDLMTAEATVPHGDVDTTSLAIEPLLHRYSWLPDWAPTDPNIGAQSFGIVQVVNGIYSAEMMTLSVDLRHYVRRPILPPFTAGIPHGFGKVLERKRIAAQTDAALRKRISNHPRAELLKMLREEALDPSEQVAAPYTVFLLHTDGTVSDYSRVHVCKISKDALYRVPKSRHSGLTQTHH
jgi:hypothetical protein